MYANTFKKCSFLAALLSSLTFTVLAHLFIIYLFVCFKCSYLHLMFCFISYCVWNFSGSSRSVVFPPGQVQTGFWGNCRSWISWNAAVECFFMCSQHVGWIIVWLQAFSVLNMLLLSEGILHTAFLQSWQHAIWFYYRNVYFLIFRFLSVNLILVNVIIYIYI